MEVRTCLGRTVGEHNAIEMTGTDWPSLLSEISAVLTNLNCNVVVAEVRTHNMRVACVVYITDNLTSRPIEDPDRMATIKEQLSNVLKGSDDRKGVEIDFSMGLTTTECRLHQMMFADRDYEGPETSSLGEDRNPIITIDSCIEKGYSVVMIRSKDRPKLLFDTFYTLIDMQYVVFHVGVNSSGSCALQEYYIRHMDGCTLDTECEKQRVIKCLEAGGADRHARAGQQSAQEGEPKSY